MNFAEYANHDSEYLKAAGRLYKMFFILLLVAYFLPTSLLAFTSSGLKLSSYWLAASPDSFFHKQLTLLNEIGPQFGLAYVAQISIYLTFPLFFSVLLVRASKELVRSAQEAGHFFPELPKLAFLSIMLSVVSFAPLVFSGYISSSAEKSISDRIIIWPLSVSITLGSSFFMMIGLHFLFLASKLAANQSDRRQ